MLDTLKTSALRLLTRAALDDGQALTEYALIIALMALVAVVSLTLLGGGVSSAVTNAAPPS